MNFDYNDVNFNARLRSVLNLKIDIIPKLELPKHKLPNRNTYINRYGLNVKVNTEIGITANCTNLTSW